MKNRSRFELGAQLAGILILAGSLQACSLMQKKVDPSERVVTDTGFEFRFPMKGEWYPGDGSRGQYVVGKKPSAEGTTTMALVRHGPIHTAGGKAMTSSEILERFQKDIEAEAKAGRVAKVKSQFSRKKRGEAECLFFKQAGEDQGPQQVMNMTNDGMICLHPTKKYNFVWMAISQRTPLGRSPENLTEDEKLFFDSLSFL